MTTSFACEPWPKFPLYKVKNVTLVSLCAYSLIQGSCHVAIILQFPSLLFAPTIDQHQIKLQFKYTREKHHTFSLCNEGCKRIYFMCRSYIVWNFVEDTFWLHDRLAFHLLETLLRTLFGFQFVLDEKCIIFTYCVIIYE